MRALRTLVLGLAVFAAASCQRAPEADHPYEKGTLLMFGGDTFFGESYAADKPDGAAGRLTEKQRYVDGFDGLLPIIKDSRYTVVNFEGPLSPQVTTEPLAKDFVHFSDPKKSVAAMERAGINAINLANNHTLDQGRTGLANTFTALSGSSIKYFGAGNNLDEAERPLVMTVPLPGGGSRKIAVIGLFQIRSGYRDLYKFYASPTESGTNPINITRFRAQVAKLRAEDPGIFIIAYPHWGMNYAWGNERQVPLGHRMIAAGADMVIGQHGHTLQEIERYNGKWIFYCIGNFAFGTPGRYDAFPDILPFGGVVGLSFGPDPKSPPVVRMFPVTADNEKTGFKPAGVSAATAKTIMDRIADRPMSEGFAGHIVETPAGAAIQLDPPKGWFGG